MAPPLREGAEKTKREDRKLRVKSATPPEKINSTADWSPIDYERARRDGDHRFWLRPPRLRLFSAAVADAPLVKLVVVAVHLSQSHRPVC